MGGPLSSLSVVYSQPSELMRPSLSPPVQVPEPHVWHAPERDDPTAEPSREGRARGRDADSRLQGLQGRNRAGGILAAWGRDGASCTHAHKHAHTPAWLTRRTNQTLVTGRKFPWLLIMADAMFVTNFDLIYENIQVMNLP